MLNDNEMSISPNVGALSSYLSRKLSAPMVRRMKGWAKEFLGSLPGDMLHWAQKAEESLKVFFSPGLLFEALGFRYVGPIQGHRIDVLLETFDEREADARERRGPDPGPRASPRRATATSRRSRIPFKYHGVGAVRGRARATSADAKPGPPKYQNVFADTLIRLAREDERIVAITAAMADGTGLDRFQTRVPRAASTTSASPSSTPSPSPRASRPRA